MLRSSQTSVMYAFAVRRFVTTDFVSAISAEKRKQLRQYAVAEFERLEELSEATAYRLGDD